MENLFNSTVLWFIAGTLLFLLEFALPGFIVFFFGIGAWVVAIITLFSPISVTTQLFIFIATSILTVLLFRKWLRKQLAGRQNGSAALEDEFVGRTAQAETLIAPGTNGKVAFKGTTWEAESHETIHPGEQVMITGFRSIILLVKSNKKL